MKTKTDNKDTQNNYSNRWEELKKFCYLQGDFQSAVVLHRTKCPTNPPPVRRALLFEYLMHKTAGTKEPLLQFGTTEPVLDNTVSVVYCARDWKCKKELTKFGGSMILLVKSYQDLRGYCTIPCTACIEINGRGGGTPGFWRSC
jgi:hypothetical protein